MLRNTDILSGYDNALFYGRLYGLGDGEIKRRLHKLADELGLSREDLKRRVGAYSDGMKRKRSFIVSLLHDPEVVILDEPTTGLGPSARREV